MVNKTVHTETPRDIQASSGATSPKYNWVGFFHLSVVYIVWGSTYLAIRVAVRPGAGFPPFTLGLTRVLPAGIILLLWAGITRKRIRLDRHELLVMVTSGTLLWLGGNGLVSWAEQRADSSLAALIITATPIWVALIEAIIDRQRPSLKLIASLLIGLLGIAVLSGPVLLSGVRADVLSIVALLAAALSWGAGTVLQSRKATELDPQVSSGYQHLFGALGFLIVIALIGESRPTPVPEAWIAWGYLIVFGSILAFTSYVRAIQALPTKIVMTYAFVNPVIAVILGAIILKEPITIWTFLGAFLVIVGVVGVFRDRYAGKTN